MLFSKSVVDEGAEVAIPDMNMSTHLFLPQDQYSLWFDGVVRCQILSVAPHHSILESLPHPVTGGPRDAQVMPFPVIDEERQFCNLQQRRCKNKKSRLFFSVSLFHTSVAAE